MKYHILLKIIGIIFLITLVIPPVEAAILTSSVAPSSIFRCQPSTISATFSDVGIISVNAYVTSQIPVLPGWQANSNVFVTQNTTVVMSWNGTYWVGTFGNDASLLWGRRTISYQIVNGIDNPTYTSSTTIFVYSDVCTGTGITNYTQMNSGLGNYTNRLFNGQYDFIGSSLDNSIIGWSIYPFIQIWGYLFYLLVIFTIVTTVYLKSQNIMQPLIIAIFLFLLFAGTSVIDPVYRQWIVFLIGVSLAGVYYKIFMRE